MTDEYPLKTVNQIPVQASLTLQPPTPVLIWFSHWLPYIAAQIKISLSRTVSSADWFGSAQEITPELYQFTSNKAGKKQLSKAFIKLFNQLILSPLVAAKSPSLGINDYTKTCEHLLRFRIALLYARSLYDSPNMLAAV